MIVVGAGWRCRTGFSPRFGSLAFLPVCICCGLCRGLCKYHHAFACVSRPEVHCQCHFQEYRDQELERVVLLPLQWRELKLYLGGWQFNLSFLASGFGHPGQLPCFNVFPRYCSRRPPGVDIAQAGQQRRHGPSHLRCVASGGRLRERDSQPVFLCAIYCVCKHEFRKVCLRAYPAFLQQRLRALAAWQVCGIYQFQRTYFPVPFWRVFQQCKSGREFWRQHQYLDHEDFFHNRVSSGPNYCV